ncbi:MAG: FHA domain-containing protein [Candidatus Thiodiazotropha sp.]
MQLTLKPLSHPSLGEIVVRDRLFPIGRHESPFSGFKHEAVARLSRRHARIFIQDSAAYLIDLDSMNGTTLNGTPLGKDPMPLKPNDKICFAGQLEFQVVTEGDDSTGAESPIKIILTLVPEKMQTVIEPIAVTEFPFLVSKTDNLFKQYRNLLPEQYKFLSRRHAHIFVQDDHLMVEDLGSTNGTFLSDRRLDEHASILKDGDTIAFGGNDFLYRVHIKTIENKDHSSLDTNELIPKALNTSTDLTRTTFVTSASSFIDIFCINDEDEEPGEVDEDSKQIPSTNKSDKSRERTPGRASIFLKELRRAFVSDTSNTNSFGLWIILTVILLAVGLIGYSYYRQSDIQEIEDFLESGSYADAIDRADSFLENNPDNNDVQEIAIKALNHYLLPTWGQRLNAGEFRGAYQSIDHSRKLASSIPLADSYFDLLRWITSINEYFAERGGMNAPISLFKDEKRIRRIIDTWEQRSGEFQKMSSRISQHSNEFNDYHARALSELRSLQSKESLYITAIDHLVVEVRKALSGDQLDNVSRLISEFQTKYPLIQGVDLLTSDLKTYRLVQEKIDTQAWQEAIEILNNTAFNTPPFRERIENLTQNELPPQDIALKYQQAADAWQIGHGDISISILSKLENSQWGEAANRLLNHRRSIWQEYQLITSTSVDKIESEKLLAFHESLDPQQDMFFIEAFATDYRAHQSEALAKATQSFSEANTAWKKYLSDGRITGITRLEASISPKFRQQAARLTEAYGKSSLAIDIYRLLDSKTPENDLQLYSDIFRETRLQRQSMLELKMVLEAELYENKISLLPETE